MRILFYHTPEARDERRNLLLWWKQDAGGHRVECNVWNVESISADSAGRTEEWWGVEASGRKLWRRRGETKCALELDSPRKEAGDDAEDEAS